MKDLLRTLEQIEEAGAGFRSITEAIDTTTPAGRMLMQILGALAEFERVLIPERTRAGLEQAKKRGLQSGRPRKLDAEQRRQAVAMGRSGEHTPTQVARLFRVHSSTVARLVAADEEHRRAAAPLPLAG